MSFDYWWRERQRRREDAERHCEAALLKAPVPPADPDSISAEFLREYVAWFHNDRQRAERAMQQARETREALEGAGPERNSTRSWAAAR